MRKHSWVSWFLLVAILAVVPIALVAQEEPLMAAAPEGDQIFDPEDHCPAGHCVDCYQFDAPLPGGGTFASWACLALGDGTLGFQRCFLTGQAATPCVALFDCDVFGAPTG